MALRLSDHGDQNSTRFQVVWLPSNAVPEQTYRSSLTQIIYKTGRKYVFCYNTALDVRIPMLEKLSSILIMLGNGYTCMLED